MKTLILIIAALAVFFGIEYKHPLPEKKKINSASVTSVDSSLNAGRVERMKYKIQ